MLYIPDSDLSYPNLTLGKETGIFFWRWNQIYKFKEFDLVGKIEQEKEIIVRVVAGDNDYIIEETFTLTLMNPCAIQSRYTLIRGIGPDEMFYQVTKDAVQATHGEYTSVVSNDDLRSLCGPLTYSATFDGDIIGPTSSPMSYDASTRTFSIFSDNELLAGDHEIAVWMHLELYPTNMSELDHNTAKVSVTYIDPCSLIDLTLNSNNNIFSDKIYSLRDLQVNYMWTASDILEDTGLDCGLLVLEFFYKDGGDYNRDVFRVDLQTTP